MIFLFFYPETRGRSLEEMSDLFGDGKVNHSVESPKYEEKDFTVGDTLLKDRPVKDIPI